MKATKPDITAVKCQCGAPATGPEQYLRRHSYAVRCSSPACPAMVVRPQPEQAVEAWNEMSTRIN